MYVHIEINAKLKTSYRLSTFIESDCIWLHVCMNEYIVTTAHKYLNKHNIHYNCAIAWLVGWLVLICVNK